MGFLDAFKEILNCSIIIPMVPLCFYPVQGYIKSSTFVLVMKIIAALTGIALLLTLIEYFVFPLPEDISGVMYTIAAYSFFLYNKEVRVSFARKLFVFLSACLVGGFSMLYATMVDYTLYPESNYMFFSIEALAAQLLFLLAADVILYLPLSRYMGWVVAYFHEETVWKRICLLPGFFLLTTYLWFPRNYSIMYSGRIKEVYPIVLVFYTLFVILVYYMFYVIAYTYVQKQKTEVANQILAIQGNQYQQLLRTVEENSRIRHDFRHQLIVISEFLGQKEYSKLEEFVHKYIADTQTEVKLYSYSAAVNALISYYETICLGKQIRTDFSVSLPERLSISDQDFCVILGNLLENAMDSAKKTDDPYIYLKIRQTAPNMLAVKVANPYQEELRKEGEHYLSSKRKGFGQGLESVNAIADKYQGMMEVLAKNQVFTVKVLLQITVGDGADCV